MRKRVRKSTWLPIMLLAYLGVMSYIGRGEFQSGNYLYYFGIISGTLLAIVLLHFFLKKKERLQNEREQDQSRNR